MRIAVVSDVHGNLTALEAVLADLDRVKPDVVVYAGDMALGGPHPVEVVDRVRELGWPAVLGNSDAVLAADPVLRDKVRGFVAEATMRTAAMLGRERVDWLTRLPIEWRQEDVVVVHAVPGDCWAVVEHDATDQALIDTFGVLGVPIAVYGHIHRPYLRRIDELTVVNSGSVSLSADGDPRASYVVLDSGRVEHHRVAYDVERVAADLLRIDYPNATGYADWLRTGNLER